jgi:hypothetical protein
MQSVNYPNPNPKRPKPFKTKQYKGKGSKAEAAQKLKEKYGHLKGGVWEPEEEAALLELLSNGNNDLAELARIFNRTVRVVRRKLKRLAISVTEESSLEDAVALTGLEAEGVRKMVANKTKREKKKLEKATNKVIPPRDKVVDLLTEIRDLLLRLGLGGPQPAWSQPDEQARQLCDYPASAPAVPRSIGAPARDESVCAGTSQVSRPPSTLPSAPDRI